jgi:hypothetical protein
VLTQPVVISLINGDVLANITQVGGSDEVWYDPGSGHYYLGARNNEDSNGTIVPVLGVIDAGTNEWDVNQPTSVSAHSVAAERVSHHVFVPIGFPAAGVSDRPTPARWSHGAALRSISRRRSTTTTIRNALASRRQSGNNEGA